MEENVALNSKKQKKFLKSIKGIKKLIKKNEEAVAVKPPVSPVIVKRKKVVTRTKKKRIPRGLVYLCHIPHGFYEHQMTQYFKQFGAVTNVRVIKSKRTGRSKGYAFVEFKDRAVAQIVAETMNNYLMGKRLIKAVYIPPEKQRHNAMRKHWNVVNNPANKLRMEFKKKFNETKDEDGELKRAKKLLSNLNKTKKRLKDMGINYDFFLPVDIPEAILENMVKTEKDKNTSTVKEEVKDKKNKKEEVEVTNELNQLTEKNAKVKKLQKNPEITVNSKENKVVKEDNIKNKAKAGKEDKIKDTSKAVNIKEKKTKQAPEVNKKEQQVKENKLTSSGIKPMGDFVKIGDSDGDSDSSLEFDSDEYEKMMGSDDEFDSADDDSDAPDNDDYDESEEDESPVISSPPVKKSKGKNEKIVSEIKKQNEQEAKKKNEVEVKKKQQLNLKNKQQNKEIKRKAPQTQAASPKKPKFEKQKNQKKVKKLKVKF